MKRLMIAFCAASFLLSCNSDEKTVVKTEETKKDSSGKETKTTSGEWVPVDSATAMKSMMEVGTPGQEHTMLAKGDGKWTAEAKMWMSPDAPPQTSKGVAENKMIMGGRYQQTSFKASMMGMSYEGTGVTGYDKARKIYFTTWMDNMSTMMMTLEGNWDDATRSINFNGKMLCPANGKECNMREVYRVIDDNKHVMEMYGPDMKTGKEYKNMEITYTRG